VLFKNIFAVLGAAAFDLSFSIAQCSHVKRMMAQRWFL
jgi:hypothetical protein